MKNIYPIVLIGLLLCSACVKTPIIPDRSMDEGMLNFLPYLNQKVAGYIDANKVLALDAAIYKQIVDNVCSPLPSCGKNAANMFETYSVQPRMLNDMFSVMLCDKGSTIKIMEDFSCNEQRVEIPSFQTDPMAYCGFENKWKEKITTYCSETR
jgi:hypothetical protein